MAYIEDEQQAEQPENSMEGGVDQEKQDENEPVAVSGQSTSIEDTGLLAQTKPEDSSPESGMFANISKYVSANKPEGQRMAGEVISQFGQQAEKLRKGSAQKTSAFETGKIAEEKGRLKSAQELSRKALENVGQEGYRAEDLRGEKYKDIRGLREGSGAFAYQNPDLIKEPTYTKEKRQAKQFQQVYPGSEAGWRQIRQALGSNMGQKSHIDEMLLRGSPEAKKQLYEGIERKTSGLGKYVAGEELKARQYEKDLAKQREAAGLSLQESIGEKEVGITSQLEEREKAEELRRRNIRDLIKRKELYTQKQDSPFDEVEFSGGRIPGGQTVGKDYFKTDVFNISPEIAAQYGTTPEEMYNLMGLQGPTTLAGTDILSKLSFQGDVSQQGMATEEDFRKAQALAALSGRVGTEAVVRGGYGQRADIFGNQGKLLAEIEKRKQMKKLALQQMLAQRESDIQVYKSGQFYDPRAGSKWSSSMQKWIPGNQ